MRIARYSTQFKKDVKLAIKRKRDGFYNNYNQQVLKKSINQLVAGKEHPKS